ncbi:hypothetical protein BASA81_003507 [Batrachochytrium salamandrivorans]|nr:hypothetical protein BASA81_003507 [Batrachochytrium salamandrivorans]
MSTFREREALARKQKEDAKRFLEATHSGPRDPSKPIPNSSLSSDSRDNTFRILQQQQPLPPSPKPASKAAVAPADKPVTAKGWEVSPGDEFIRHQQTGCAVRLCPPQVVGKGLSSWRDLPVGWKLIKRTTAAIEEEEDATLPKVYFWNPFTLESTFVFPSAPAPVAAVMTAAAEEEEKVVTREDAVDKKEELAEAPQMVITSVVTATSTAIPKRRKLACFD